MSLAAGTRLGPCEITSLIGAGGMGEVYRARDRLGREVAIKIVNAPFTERFEREARAISALNHPHICTLYDVGSVDGTGYLVIELVEREPLRGPMPWKGGASCRRGVRRAAGGASQGDRPSRPQTWQRAADPARCEVIDFGLARQEHAGETTTAAPTVAGTVLGTAAYMAPEQASGGPIDARADLWAVGILLFELLSGKWPFRGGESAILAELLDPPAHSNDTSWLDKAEAELRRPWRTIRTRPGRTRRWPWSISIRDERNWCRHRVRQRHGLERHVVAPRIICLRE